MEFSSNQVAMQYIPCLLGCTAPAGPDGRSVLAPSSSTPHRLAKQLSATGSVTSTPSVESVIQVIGLLASILISID
jgi:hypothetical protein